MVKRVQDIHGDGRAIPTGTVFPFAGTSAPSGWLLCGAQEVSRVTYSNLFSTITLRFTGNTTSGNATISSVTPDPTTTGIVAGMPISGTGIPGGATVASFTATSITLSANATATNTGTSLVVAPYGVGNGTTTFNVPDMRGRSPFGRDDMGGVPVGNITSGGSSIAGNRVGASGGSQNKTLLLAEIPAHQHGVSTSNPAPTRVTTGGTLPVSASGNTGLVSANHGHTVWTEGGTNRTTSPGGLTGGPFSTNIHYSSSQDANHTHTFSFSTTAAGSGVTISGVTDLAGSNSSFAMMNPTLILNYIIKY